MSTGASKRPTIQSFFQSEVGSAKTQKTAKTVDRAAGGGFCAFELSSALHPSLPPWQPHLEYQAVKLADLKAGPGRFAVTGRVVNFQAFHSHIENLYAAKGYFFIIIQDDSGPLKVWIS